MLVKLQKKAVVKRASKYQVNDIAVADIVFLGIRGRPGTEKKAVLLSLEYCSKAVQSAKHYQHGQLDAVIMGIGTILSAADLRADDQNFQEGGRILNSILDRCSSNTSSDFTAAVRTLERLSTESIRYCSDSTVSLYLESVSAPRVPLPLAARGLHNMGITALELKKFHLALAVLNRLESIARTSLPNQARAPVLYLVAFISRFWFKSIVARSRMSQSLAAVSTGPISDFVLSVSHYFTERGDFEIGDSVLSLSKELRGHNQDTDDMQSELPLL
ncbi:MAG TPA: hypothetical protein VFJ82_11545 [Longimicrobium sp.]|nr:hypothetical protein [Longimicrobium sp.]